MTLHAPEPPLALSELQLWFQSVLTHPSGIEAAAKSETPGGHQIELDGVISRSQRLSSADRLRIYGNAYFARLLECLRAEYPATVMALGEDAFNGLAFGYLLQNPSQSYTLSRLGALLPSYLAQTRPARLRTADEPTPDFADFLIDLVTLERTYSEVFDGTGPEQSSSLIASDLESLSVEQFASSRLILHDCVRLLTLRFPVHEFASSVKLNPRSDIPSARQTHVVVTRRNYVVRRIEVTPIQFALLTALREETSVGKALLAVTPATNIEMDELTANLRAWFYEWSLASLFRQLIIAPASSEFRLGYR